MKNLTILFLAICSITVQAQIVQYVNISGGEQNFYKLGGYSYTEQSFPTGVQVTPYVRTGPSPQNDFQYVATATGGIKNLSNAISTTNVGTGITLKMKNNNIKKFGANVITKTPNGTTITSDAMILSVFTNQGNIQSYIFGNSTITWMGLEATGTNEYIDSVKVRYLSASTNVITIGNIMVGDNSPQNVSLNFDGVNDYVSIPSNVGNFGTNDNFTVSCWFRPDPTGTGEQELIGKWDFSSGTNFAFTIRYNSTNGTTYAGQFTDPTFSTVGSSTDLRDGKWHHIAFTKNASILELVVDGVSAGTGTDNATGETTNGLPLNIGRRGGSGSNYFKGEIDEVRIWNIAKTATEIANERFCKTPNTTNLVAFYNFNNGVPHDNNALITKVQDASINTNHGTLNGFAKTGDASNFVTGQVRYVKNNATGSNKGSSWANAFIDLQFALTATTCNDLFEVYVAKGNAAYKPAAPNGDFNTYFNIPSGIRIYGGFAGTETNINQRNLALIHSTNKTTLSGDLNGNDTPFIFTTNRTDNSNYLVYLPGNNVFDGFTVSGVGDNGTGIYTDGTNATIKNSRVIDNTNSGLSILGGNATIANCSIMGNESTGININNSTASIKECLIANNGFAGIDIFVDNGTRQTTITNSTIASNADYGIRVGTFGSTSTNTLKNTLIYSNASGGISNDNFGGTISNTTTYSLVQGVTTGTGNLNGNTVNPQFVSPLANNVRSDAGDYRLKDISPCINVGTDVGVSPLDLDRNPRPKGGKTDMGAYESNINLNEIISIITGNWENTTTWNLERIPLPTDKVIVNGHQVTVTTNTARAKNLEYKTGAILRYLSGGLLRFGL